MNKSIHGTEQTVESQNGVEELWEIRLAEDRKGCVCGQTVKGIENQAEIKTPYGRTQGATESS